MNSIDQNVVNNRAILRYPWLMENLAKYSVIFAVLILPFSHHLLRTAIYLAAICCVFSGGFKKNINLLRNLIPLWCVVLLVAYMLITAFYSPVGIARGLSGSCKYTKLLLMFFLIPILIKEEFRKIILYCFVISVCLFSVFSIFHLKLTGNIAIFSVFQAFSLYLLLFFIKQNKRNVIYYAAFFCIIYSMIFIMLERTGVLAFVGLGGLFIIQQRGFKNAIPYIVGFLIVAFVLVSFSSALRYKALDVYHSVLNYNVNSKTDVGFRVVIYKAATKIIIKHPIFGLGAGSFQQELTKLYPDYPDFFTSHSGFLYITAQGGLIALSLLFSFLFYFYKSINLMPSFEKKIGLGFLLMFTYVSCINITWASVMMGNFGIIMFSLFLASCRNVDERRIASSRYL